MTQEETNKRNEAIVIMLSLQTQILIVDPRYWHWLMIAYEYILKLGYHGTIEDLGIPGHRVYFTDKNFKEVGAGNRDEDLRTAIWLTVSDFAIEFNKKKS